MSSPNSIKPLQFAKYTPLSERQEQKSKIVLSPRGKKQLIDVIDPPAKSTPESQAPNRPLPPTPLRRWHLSSTDATAPDDLNISESSSDKITLEKSDREEKAEGNQTDLSLKLIPEAREEKPESAFNRLESPLARARSSLKPPKQLITGQPRAMIVRNQTSDDQHSFPIHRIELNTTYEENTSEKSPERLSSTAKRNAFRTSKYSPIRTGRLALRDRGSKTEAFDSETERFESSSSTTEGDLPMSPSRKFAMQLPTRDQSPAKMKIRGGIRSPRAAIKEARKAKADRLKAKEVEAREAKLQAVRANLPAGVNFDDEGRLKGTQIATHFPTSGTNTRFYGVAVEVALQNLGTERINDTKMRPKEIGGVLVVNAAKADFTRLYFEIPNFDGTPNFDGKSTNATDVAQALEGFAGDANTALVLSSVMSQSLAGLLLFATSSPDGADLPHLQIATMSGARLRNLTVFGAKDPIETEGVGGMKCRVSRAQGNFRIDIELNAYCEQPPVRNQILPLHKNGVIEVGFRTQLIIDGAEALKGNLKLSIPDGIRSDWSGRLDLSLLN